MRRMAETCEGFVHGFAKTEKYSGDVADVARETLLKLGSESMKLGMTRNDLSS